MSRLTPGHPLESLHYYQNTQTLTLYDLRYIVFIILMCYMCCVTTDNDLPPRLIFTGTFRCDVRSLWWFMCLYHQLISVLVTTVVTLQPSPAPILSSPLLSSSLQSTVQLLVLIVHTNVSLRAKIWRNSRDGSDDVVLTHYCVIIRRLNCVMTLLSGQCQASSDTITQTIISPWLRAPSALWSGVKMLTRTLSCKPVNCI